MKPNRLARFRNIHRGKRAVIVCNGPSLNQMDLGFLRGETVFGLNKIHLGLDRFGFTPRYLVAVNDKVIAQSEAAYRRLEVIKFLSDRHRRRFAEDERTYFLNTTGVSVPFCPDITYAVREGHTVTHAALQIAYFMGFAQVVIIGMDHRFAYEGAANTPQKLRGDDPNHFSPAYFADQMWDTPNLRGSEQSYRAARAWFEGDGRQIIDATVGGACDIFPKVDHREIFATRQLLSVP